MGICFTFLGGPQEGKDKGNGVRCSLAENNLGLSSNTKFVAEWPGSCRNIPAANGWEPLRAHFPLLLVIRPSLLLIFKPGMPGCMGPRKTCPS